MIAHRQLVALGFTRHAIRHRIETGRLHRVFRGVYAVGRPELSDLGVWMAATLTCGGDAVVSYLSAAALWRVIEDPCAVVDVSVIAGRCDPQRGIRLHRRRLAARDITKYHGIPVTTPVLTLIDLAPLLTRDELEAAINEADKRDLVNPVRLRRALENYANRPGVAILRETLDARTFTITDSQLERLFLPIARRVGLPKPLTQQWVNGRKVDFYWPELGLVVETDGLRYHRTPAQQTKDAIGIQIHAAAGLTPLRFTRAQVKYDPEHVLAILTAVAHRLQARNRR